MSSLERTRGIEESARRIEQVLEVVRDEMAKSGEETNWSGLSRHFATGAAETRKLALELASLQRSNESDALIHIFMLRQLEITLAFISKLSSQLEVLPETLAHLENELTRLKDAP